MLQHCLPPFDDEESEVVEVFEHDDFSYAAAATDQNQVLNIIFYIHFDQQLHNFALSEAFSTYQKQDAEDKHSTVYFNTRILRNSFTISS